MDAILDRFELRGSELDLAKQILETDDDVAYSRRHLDKKGSRRRTLDVAVAVLGVARLHEPVLHELDPDALPARGALEDLVRLGEMNNGVADDRAAERISKPVHSASVFPSNLLEGPPGLFYPIVQCVLL